MFSNKNKVRYKKLDMRWVYLFHMSFGFKYITIDKHMRTYHYHRIENILEIVIYNGWNTRSPNMTAHMVNI